MSIYSDVSMYVGRYSNKEIVTDYTAIDQNIFLISVTPIRSKWFRIPYGSNIPKYLFEPMDEITANRIRNEMRRLLERNDEFRIILNTYEVVPNYEDRVYVVTLSYVAPEISDKPYEMSFSLFAQGD